MLITELKKRVLAGYKLTREDAVQLLEVPLEELTKAADEIRNHFCGNGFDICTIVNAKCVKCSEDCKYCAQSAHYHTDCTEAYPLLDTAELVEGARHNKEQGVLRYSLVTSGRALSDEEVDKICESIKAIREQVGIKVCVSFGLLNKEQYAKIHAAGATRVHCNLESSRRYFPQICTTHTYEEKIASLKAAKEAGMSICSGGILGLGETFEDRIDMVLTARELGVKSIPVNVLNPIPGTPYAHNPVLSNAEVSRFVAIFRFLIPDGAVRLAGGRGLLGDKGEMCFTSGANAAISGDMLTTAGITMGTDMQLLKKLGYEARLCNE